VLLLNRGESIVAYSIPLLCLNLMLYFMQRSIEVEEDKENCTQLDNTEHETRKNMKGMKNNNTNPEVVR